METLSAQFPRNVLSAAEAAEALEAAGEHDAARAQQQANLARAAAHAPRATSAPRWTACGTRIEQVYPHWSLTAQDFKKAEAQPGALPRCQPAAALAAG